jgi:hypothetical protein
VTIDFSFFRAVAPARRGGLLKHTQRAEAAHLATASVRQCAPRAWQPPVTARDGTVRRTDAGGTTTVIGGIPVYAHHGDGLQGIGVDRGTPGADHFDWPRLLAGLAATGYGGAVCIVPFTAQNEAVATAASICRPLAPSRDTLARDGLSYLRTVLRGLENAPLTG